MKRVLILLLVGLLSACSSSFNVNSHIITKIEVHSEFNAFGYDSTKSIQNPNIRSDLNLDKLGTYTLNYSMNSLFGKVNLVRKIKVLDQTKPVIKLNGETDIYLCPNIEYIDEGVSVSDNYDTVLIPVIQTNPDKSEFVYTVTDSSGNIASVTRGIHYGNYLNPTMNLNGYDTFRLGLDSKYTELGATAFDQCSGKPLEVTIKQSIDMHTEGTYSVVYSATDEFGNTGTITRTVNVVKQDPTIVYLTFDDGPSINTLSVLNTLKRYECLATFFVNHRPNYAKYLVQAYQAGHTIALHSYSHNYDSIYSSSTAYFNDLNNLSNWVDGLIGIHPKILRFPGGSSNSVSDFNHGIMTTLTNEVLAQGYHYFDWNVSTG
ncbi:MAG: immunoglobulin-like domain-containing protein, partial [Erysipelotrichaceae bacterium]